MNARLASHDSIPLSITPRHSSKVKDDNGMNTRPVDDYQTAWNENRIRGNLIEYH